MKIQTFGSVCSGIEAATYVLEPLGVKPLWLSEIEEFPCRFLQTRYANIPNVGDMNDVPNLIRTGIIEAPDLLCGGTPCQAFSFAGWREGVNDHRGQLTLRFFDILNEIDKKREAKGLGRAVCFWENVEGVLSDKDNAFGCFLSGLAGLDMPITPYNMGHGQPCNGKRNNAPVKWSDAGVLFGKTRNVAWRVLDAKYFGLPQQRKRIYVIAGGKDFRPQDVLFEMGDVICDPFRCESANRFPALFEIGTIVYEDIKIDKSLCRRINGVDTEIFRTYTDCLYAAYGTKWNGNAAAMNGSLFVAQNGRLRRLTPIEAERIMGFPDNYTLLERAKDTQRYKAIGNSWAVNVIKWLMKRLCEHEKQVSVTLPDKSNICKGDYSLYLFRDFVLTGKGLYVNASNMPYDIKVSNLLDYVETNADEKFYISSAGCAGILRRKREHNSSMNSRLEMVLANCS